MTDRVPISFNGTYPVVGHLTDTHVVGTVVRVVTYVDFNKKVSFG